MVLHAAFCLVLGYQQVEVFLHKIYYTYETIIACLLALHPFPKLCKKSVVSQFAHCNYLIECPFWRYH